MKNSAGPHWSIAKLPSRAILDLRLTDADFRVLAIIATFGHNKRYGERAHPSLATIARAKGMSPTQAKKISPRIKKLRELGYLEVVPERTQTGTINTYKIILVEEELLPSHGDAVTDLYPRQGEQAPSPSGGTPPSPSGGIPPSPPRGTDTRITETRINDAATQPRDGGGESNLPSDFPEKMNLDWAAQTFPEVNLKLEVRKFRERYKNEPRRSWDRTWAVFIGVAAKEYQGVKNERSSDEIQNDIASVLSQIEG